MTLWTDSNYTVTAEDASTVSYTATVTVAPASTEKAISSFQFKGLTPEASANIDATAKTITAVLPASTDLTNLVPTIAISAKASISPASGVAQNFTNPVIYTVTAEDASTVSYTATITVAIVKSSAKDVTATTIGTLDAGAKSITAIPYKTKVSELKAAITLSTLATAKVLVSTGGAEADNTAALTSTMVIQVTAEDGSTQEYSLSVKEASKISALKTLAIDKGTLNPAFEPAVLRYTSTLPYGTTTVTVSATVSETSFATVTIQQANVTSTVEANRSAVVKVTAEDGVTESVYSIAFSIETVDPNVVATVAELRAKTADNTTIYTLTGEVVMSFAGDYRNQKFVQDATGGIVIDDNAKVITSTYNVGDGIKGLKGKLTLFKGLLEFVPTQDPGAASSAGNKIVPKAATISELPNLQGQLVKITGLSFAATGNFVTTTATNYTLTSEENSTVVLRTAYKNVDYEGKAIPTEKVNVTALVYCYNTPQLMLRAYADIAISSGLKNAEELGVSVYPNPVIDMLTINQASNIDQIELYSTEGKKLVSKKCKSESITLDMHNFNSGIYLLNLHSKDGKSAIVKILK